MIALRPMSHDGDSADGFVIDAWVRSLHASLLDTIEPFELSSVLVAQLEGPWSLRPYISALLRRDSTRVFVIEDADERGAIILGFIACEPGRVHYVYVKKHLRQRGLAKRLLKHAAEQCGAFERTSTLTRTWVRLWAQELGLGYDPSIERQST